MEYDALNIVSVCRHVAISRVFFFFPSLGPSSLAVFFSPNILISSGCGIRD